MTNLWKDFDPDRILLGIGEVARVHQESVGKINVLGDVLKRAEVAHREAMEQVGIINKALPLIADRLHRNPKAWIESEYGTRRAKVSPSSECIERMLEWKFPLLHSSPAKVMAELEDALTREDAIEVLLRNQDLIMDRCVKELRKVNSPSIKKFAALEERACAAFSDGHHEASMALAVVALDTMIFKVVTGWTFPYRKSSKDGNMTVLEAQREENLREMKEVGVAIIAKPLIETFYSGYRGQPEEIYPFWPNRHATVHHPTEEHLSSGNALSMHLLAATTMQVVDRFRFRSPSSRRLGINRDRDWRIDPDAS